jgi:4-amino-4-deoxy-L-arabinose transferase-like glycosyltransferase
VTLPRLAALLPRTARSRTAAAWAVATLAVAALTAPAQGIGRDEGVYLVAAESYAAFPGAVVRAPTQALALADRHFAANHEHPPLAKEVYGVTHALLADALRLTSHLEGFRFGAFLFAALLSSVLAAWGWDLAGRAGALLAPALFWAVPRHFYHAHPAALDLPVTALWAATVFAYARSLRAPEGRPRVRAALLAGALFGAAVSTKHNAWFLPPLLLAHWVASSALALRRATWAERLQRVPLAFPAMALLGPLVLLAAWPWLWRDPVARFAEYARFHLHHENYSWLYLGRVLREPPFPVAYPFVVTALTVPAAVLLAMTGGLVHALARAASFHVHPPANEERAGEGGEARDAASASDEVLLLLNALFPIALIAWPSVPRFGGVKHWLPAMPFLALLGARALVAAAHTLWPARAGWLTAALAAFALAPAAWSVAHVHPYGTAAYNELAGGAPGAATLGMQRQFWGDDAVGVLDELNAHAIPGARVWWQETARSAVAAWQRDGRVRADLRWAEGPEEADLSIWQYHQEFRDKEYRTWTAFAERPRPGERARLPRPVAGVYLDEVPLVQVYARAGAWR